VDKELANIRSKFTSSSSLSSYQKKKYVWKLVYIFMLGYDVEFGHAEVVQLVGSAKYSEKQVGYVAMSLLLKDGDQMITMVINSIRNDLISSNSDADAGISLALCSIANVSGITIMKVSWVCIYFYFFSLLLTFFCPPPTHTHTLTHTHTHTPRPYT